MSWKGTQIINSITAIKTRENNNQETRIFFSSNMSQVNEFAKMIFKKDLPAENETEALVLVLVHCEFILSRFYEAKAIFVTEKVLFQPVFHTLSDFSYLQNM